MYLMYIKNCIIYKLHYIKTNINIIINNCHASVFNLMKLFSDIKHINKKLILI